MHDRIHEIRLMWLMSLIIVAITAWTLEQKILTALCLGAVVLSVMSYVDAIEQGLQRRVAQVAHRKIALYLCSMLAVLGGVFDVALLVLVGAGGWIFLLLRWLQRLEQQLGRYSVDTVPDESLVATPPLAKPHETMPLSLFAQLKQWIFTGNPVLQTAVVVLLIGLILLLRFATVHWQLSLGLKLGAIASLSALIVLCGSVNKRRSFALALQGLGLAGLFLCLFFAQDAQLGLNMAISLAGFILLMAINIYLSLKQNALALAFMALSVAYIAPFTLPDWPDMSLLNLCIHYLCVNVGVALLSSVRPWKVLNHFALLMTVLIGMAYASYQFDPAQNDLLALLIVLHSAIFIWLALRFSQLMLSQQPNVRPLFDIAFMFSAPILAYAGLYLLYFQRPLPQAGFSVLFAGVFALLYYRFQRHPIALIRQSYLSLALIFVSLLPPIVLPEQLSIVGWCLQGLVILAWGLWRNHAVARALALAFMLMAGGTSLYYMLNVADVSDWIEWVLALSYLTYLILINVQARFAQQLTTMHIVAVGMMSAIATALLFKLFNADWDTVALAVPYSLLSILLIYTALNEIFSRQSVAWSWVFPKTISAMLMLCILMYWCFSDFSQGQMLWSKREQFLALLMGLLLARLSQEVQQDGQMTSEWAALSTLSALGLASLSLYTADASVSMAVLPLFYGCYCLYTQRQLSFWQTRSVLIVFILWLLIVPFFRTQPFIAYWMPIVNPSDMLDLAMLSSVLWMLYQQTQQHLERALAMMLAVLVLLWVSSQVMLRALHYYLATPMQGMQIWHNATVQLSFTLLWLILALLTMCIASKKQMRLLWLLGSSLIVIVAIKLLILDLANVGTLMRVLSFLLAGGLMLCIAYLAPMPQRSDAKQNQVES